MTTTYSGRLLVPGNYGVPTLLDIAVQLGRIVRFAGAGPVWWSVLHHVANCYSLAASVEVRDALGFRPGASGLDSVGTALLVVMLHDADEVATSDVPTLWKTDDMRRQTAPLQARVFREYIGRAPTDIERAFCKAVDLLALRSEAQVIGPPGVLVHSGLAGVSVDPALREHACAVVDTLHAEHPDPYSSAMGEGSPLVLWFLRMMETLGAKR